MKDVAIVGAGGFGRETAWLVAQLPQFKLVGFFDDGVSEIKIDGVPVLGKVADVTNLSAGSALVVAIANPHIREKIIQQIDNGFDFPNVIHPTVSLGGPRNAIGRGNIITAGVIITTHVHIKDFCIINLGCTIGHDTVLSNYSSLMPQCSISGNVMLGDRCFVGAGARILQNLELGADTVVGAGAVVTKSYSAGKKLMGVPAKEYVD